MTLGESGFQTEGDLCADDLISNGKETPCHPLKCIAIQCHLKLFLPTSRGTDMPFPHLENRGLLDQESSQPKPRSR